jgi:putative ATP-binding cassette transporter
MLFIATDEKGFTFGFTLLASCPCRDRDFEFYLTQWLTIRWRRWMTDKFLNEWMADRAYYKISLAGSHDLGTDNPDQRITEDIRDYTDTTLTLTWPDLARRHVVQLFVDLVGLSAAIQFWGVSVPGSLVLDRAVLCLIAGTICTHFTGGRWRR